MADKHFAAFDVRMAVIGRGLNSPCLTSSSSYSAGTPAPVQVRNQVLASLDLLWRTVDRDGDNLRPMLVFNNRLIIHVRVLEKERRCSMTSAGRHAIADVSAKVALHRLISVSGEFGLTMIGDM